MKTVKTVPFYIRSMNTEHKLYIGLYFTACFDEAGVHSVEKKRRHKIIRSCAYCNSGTNQRLKKLHMS